ncbi:unnamed protein product [Cuscuta campestris]|uniref:IBH1-like N-terminal domain-containing protein n=1 Tax=Cuscuta campestris TaxID=132261 RepID=A0A484NMY2_9ASTE|nr:unnamed protein product [Cuscuta campestris]
MESSSSIGNPDVNPNRSRKMRRTIGDSDRDRPQPTCVDGLRWRTQAARQIYSSKLVNALRQVRRRNMTPSPAVAGRAIRDTAYRVLAVAAKGRTRWSRAILAGRLSKKHKRAPARAIPGDIRSKKPAVAKRLPPLQRKARVLGRLVPGCRKLPFPNLLDEATDYIAALEMQVKAMSVLVELLNRAGMGILLPNPDRLRLGSEQSQGSAARDLR